MRGFTALMNAMFLGEKTSLGVCSLGLILVVLTVLLASLAHADITGRASVIDGDTLEIRGQRVRLHGIDAPESRQTCDMNGKPWQCGQKAAFALAELIGTKTVICNSESTDHYGRMLATCSLGDVNLNAWLVENGWALAYRKYSLAYVPHEKIAAAERRGIWAGAFTPPWEWRRHGSNVPSVSDPAEDRRCRIKGNISAKGERIYHLPGSRWYERAVIDEATGERWFCTEEEARAAGWRKAGG